jgi:hypothetical protein
MSHCSTRVLIQCFALPTVLALGHSSVALAVEPEGSRAGREALTLQTDLITPFFGTYYLEANARVSNHLGVLFNASNLSLENGDWKTNTGTLGAGLSYYFQGEALRRWYVEAVGEANLSSWRHEPSGKVAPILVGYTGIAVAGYRFIWGCGLVLDLAAGVVVLHLPSARVATVDGFVSSEALTRVYPAAKLNVGWAF